jgi:hypothetical protein
VNVAAIIPATPAGMMSVLETCDEAKGRGFLTISL